MSSEVKSEPGVAGRIDVRRQVARVVAWSQSGNGKTEIEASEKRLREIAALYKEARHIPWEIMHRSFTI